MRGRFWSVTQKMLTGLFISSGGLKSKSNDTKKQKKNKKKQWIK